MQGPRDTWYIDLRLKLYLFIYLPPYSPKDRLRIFGGETLVVGKRRKPHKEAPCIPGGLVGSAHVLADAYPLRHRSRNTGASPGLPLPSPVKALWSLAHSGSRGAIATRATQPARRERFLNVPPARGSQARLNGALPSLRPSQDRVPPALGSEYHAG